MVWIQLLPVFSYFFGWLPRTVSPDESQGLGLMLSIIKLVLPDRPINPDVFLSLQIFIFLFISDRIIRFAYRTLVIHQDESMKTTWGIHGGYMAGRRHPTFVRVSQKPPTALALTPTGGRRLRVFQVPFHL